jgi:hypothetical protein
MACDKEKVNKYKKEYREKNREKHREYCKKYKSTHKEQVKKARKEYQDKHKEKCNEYRKKYNSTHKEKVREIINKYQEKHKEEIKAYQKQYYLQHKEELKARSKKWQNENKTRYGKNVRKSYQKNRDKQIALVKRPGLATRINSNSPDLADPNIWEQLRIERNIKNSIVARNNPKNKFRIWAAARRDKILSMNWNMCSICGSKDKLEIHHKEYENTLWAVTVLCEQCHKKKHESQPV